MDGRDAVQTSFLFIYRHRQLDPRLHSLSSISSTLKYAKYAKNAAMQSLAFFTVAAAALLQGVSAMPAAPTSSPTSLPGHYVCTSITTVTTTKAPPFVCDFVCAEPTKVCKQGEPAEAPFPTITTTPLPGCTVSVEVQRKCECPTCVVAPIPQQTA
ncbi:hypothetical protein GGS26DRAFT_423872 [Hypomontagnella submonticulosa]|nr:hypothetical protein GGS26DRAFT_423872 [Hypomontagnella submonticulosa]